MKAAEGVRDRLSRRILNYNEPILNIARALAEALRFAHHNHQNESLVDLRQRWNHSFAKGH
ncbi:hypothetical protein H6F76_13285 [Leptolyngbya sp. FACHB-321]|uniref:hypothetical protein n=1 Tax=Leptolyngbya sp. FACHB-321 TaxID=2692807 RepID=UPI001681C74B|nr:hypothetical protein [Leptolyngbya sp. FACHB-321]MBD2035992.1 hypothetical protein [Leptolyngbya sp. FACHB-321]